MSLNSVQKELERQKRLATKEGHQKLLGLQLEIYHLPWPLPEYQFHPPRQWRIDFGWPESKIALEVEGGIYGGKGGGHRSISGFEAGLEKYNQLAIDGWRLIRVLPEWLDEKNGRAITLVRQMLEPLSGGS